MDNDQKTSNALLVVLATFVVTVAFLGIVIEYFDKDKEVVTTFWAPPWTVELEADSDAVGLPETVTLAVDNKGTKELYGRSPILIFAKDRKITATAHIDNDMADFFSVDSEKERSITLDLSNLDIETLDGHMVGPAELAEGMWTIQAVFYVLREDSPRPRLAWSGLLDISAKKDETKSEDGTE